VQSSIATPVTAPKGGQFVLHAKALHGNPTTATRSAPCPIMPISKSSQALRSAASTATRATAATTTPTDSRFGSAARSAVSPKLSAASRAAVEPVIGHLKGDHRMRRNHLKGRDGDRVDAVLAAGYNFSLVRAGSSSSCASTARIARWTELSC